MNKLAPGMVVQVPAHPEWGVGKVLDREVAALPGAGATLERYRVEFHLHAYATHVLYAENLSRVIFPENTQLRTVEGGVVTVESDDVSLDGNLIVYRVLSPAGRLEALLESRVETPLYSPLERLVRGDVDAPARFLLHNWAAALKFVYTSKTLKAVTSSRLMLLPHQVFIAHRLTSELHPRYLLADEVGLGKTIEAGIVIKELLARNLAHRVLIVPPASLVTQWEFEMANKFNERFEVVDSRVLKRIRKETGLVNPFVATPKAIISLQYARKPEVRQLLKAVFWDVVVFDEAHHLRRYITNSTRYRETLAYALGRALSQNSGALLLLTATPIQLHSFELFSLVKLLDPSLFPTYQAFEEFREFLPSLNMLLANLHRFRALNHFEREALLDYLKEYFWETHDKDFSTRFLAKKLVHDKRFVRKLEHELERKHLLARVLIRNKKRNIFAGKLPDRVPRIVEVTLTPEEEALYKRIRLFIAKTYNRALSDKNQGLGFVMVVLQKLLASSRYALLATLEKRIHKMETRIETQKEAAATIPVGRTVLAGLDQEDLVEVMDDLDREGAWEDLSEEEAEQLLRLKQRILDEQYLEILREFHRDLLALETDSKLDATVALIREIFANDPAEKVLIFTQFRKTMAYLKRRIQAEGVRVTTFHGGLSKEAKDRRVTRFKGPAQVMISTEIGGEGRNFHFCHILVNFDLPWNPMRIEQRIGRLDRLGQTRDVIVYNFYVKNTIEADVLSVLNDRIKIFEETIGGLEPILGQVKEGIQDLYFSPTEGSAYDQSYLQFGRDLDDALAQVKEMELRLSDFVLDRKSFQMKPVHDLLQHKISVKSAEIRAFVRSALEFLESPGTGRRAVAGGSEGPMEELTDHVVQVRLPESCKDRLALPAGRGGDGAGSSGGVGSGADAGGEDGEEVKDGAPLVTGTFDLETARAREDIEFFALGHPLVDALVNHTYAQDFGGSVSHLSFSRAAMEDLLATIVEDPQFRQRCPGDFPCAPPEGLLFVFHVQYRGVYFEHRLFPVFVTRDLEVNDDFSRALFHALRYPERYASPAEARLARPEAPSPGDAPPDERFVRQARTVAQAGLEDVIAKKRAALQPLNRRYHATERDKVTRLHEFTLQQLEAAREEIVTEIARREGNRPTARQRANIEQLQDPARKQERLAKVQDNADAIDRLREKLASLADRRDEAAFDFEDALARLDRYAELRFETSLYSVARVHFT